MKFRGCWLFGEVVNTIEGLLLGARTTTSGEAGGHLGAALCGLGNILRVLRVTEGAFTIGPASGPRLLRLGVCLWLSASATGRSWLQTGHLQARRCPV